MTVFVFVHQAAFHLLLLCARYALRQEPDFTPASLAHVLAQSVCASVCASLLDAALWTAYLRPAFLRQSRQPLHHHQLLSSSSSVRYMASAGSGATQHNPVSAAMRARVQPAAAAAHENNCYLYPTTAPISAVGWLGARSRKSSLLLALALAALGLLLHLFV